MDSTLRETLNLFIDTPLKQFSSTEKMIVCSLLSCMKEKQGILICEGVTQDTLAQSSGSTRKKVNATLKKAEKLGYISSTLLFNNSKVYNWEWKYKPTSKSRTLKEKYYITPINGAFN